MFELLMTLGILVGGMPFACAVITYYNEKTATPSPYRSLQGGIILDKQFARSEVMFWSAFWFVGVLALILMLLSSVASKTYDAFTGWIASKVQQTKKSLKAYTDEELSETIKALEAEIGIDPYAGMTSEQRSREVWKDGFDKPSTPSKVKETTYFVSNGVMFISHKDGKEYVFDHPYDSCTPKCDKVHNVDGSGTISEKSFASFHKVWTTTEELKKSKAQADRLVTLLYRDKALQQWHGKSRTSPLQTTYRVENDVMYISHDGEDYVCDVVMMSEAWKEANSEFYSKTLFYLQEYRQPVQEKTFHVNGTAITKDAWESFIAIWLADRQQKVDKKATEKLLAKLNSNIPPVNESIKVDRELQSVPLSQTTKYVDTLCDMLDKQDEDAHQLLLSSAKSLQMTSDRPANT